MSLEKNKGKGSALERGIREVHSRNNNDGGTVILLVDADRSGDISYLDDMMTSLVDLLQSSSPTQQQLPNNNTNTTAIVESICTNCW